MTITADHLRGITWEPLVSSRAGRDFLGTVPVAGGSVTWSIRRDVQGSLDLIVPRVTPGPVDWMPRHADEQHPLSPLGQVLTVAVRATTPVSKITQVRPCGEFLITAVQDEGDHVRVTGQSLLRRLEEDALHVPTASRGTLESEVERISGEHMGKVFDPALVDRPVPAMVWADSRLAALYEIADAWPARMREDGTGILRWLPPLPDDILTPPELVLSDASHLISGYETLTREGIYNTVNARGVETDDAGSPTIAYTAWQRTGPYGVGRYGSVVAKYSSPLLTAWPHVVAAAHTRLANLLRPARTIPCVAAPDPRIELDATARVDTYVGTALARTAVGYVSGYTLPLVPGDDMRVDVEVI